MINENNKRIAKNTMMLYIRMLVMIIVSLYTTRVVLTALGFDDYGIYNVVGGIVVLFAFVNSGLTGATKRYILEELAIGNSSSQRRIFSTAINAHFLLVSIILVLGETIGLLIFYYWMNIPPDRMSAAMWVYQVSLLTSILTVLASPFNSVIITYEKMSAFAYFSIIDAGLKLLVAFIVLYSQGDKLIFYAVLMLLTQVVSFLLYYTYCKKNFYICKYVKGRDKKTLLSLLKFVGWSVFGTGANVLSRQGVSILVNNFFSVTVNAAIGISNMIVNTATQFVTNFQTAFAPQLTKNYISKNYKDLIILINRASRYASFLILIILLPASIVISDLLTIWLGDYPKYSEEFCLLTLVCVYFESIANPLILVITSDRDIGRYQRICSYVYLSNILFCWIVLRYGSVAYSVVIVRLVLDLVLLIVRLILTRNRVHTFSISKWINTILVRAAAIVLLFVPMHFICQLFVIHGEWLRLFVYGGVCFLYILIIIWLIGLTSNEKTFLLEKISLKISNKR